MQLKIFNVKFILIFFQCTLILNHRFTHMLFVVFDNCITDPEFILRYCVKRGVLGGASGKQSACECRRHKRGGVDSWTTRSPGVGNATPPQYPCLENSTGRGASWATVHSVAQSNTTEHTKKTR